VQAQLGHSSITLTRDVYGAWSRRAEKLEAQRLDGAFTV
jgi:integrase